MRVPALRGEMVRLRPIEARDADAMWEMVGDPEGRRLTGTTATFTRERIEDWAASVADLPGRVDLAITAVDSDEFLGEIVLNRIDDAAGCANLRLALRPGYRGRGYGGEAIPLVLDLAFAPAPEGLGLHRVGLDVLGINPRARMLYESLGFVEEGRLREAHRDGDHWTDVIVMGVLADDPRPRRGGR